MLTIKWRHLLIFDQKFVEDSKQDYGCCFWIVKNGSQTDKTETSRWQETNQVKGQICLKILSYQLVCSRDMLDTPEGTIL